MTDDNVACFPQRLATTRNLDALYAEVAAALEALGAADGGPDIELVPGDLLDCTSTGDYVVMVEGPPDDVPASREDLAAALVAAVGAL